MLKHVKRTLAVLATVAAVGLVWGGMALSDPPSGKGGAKDKPPPLPPPEPASGTIYFWDQGDPYGDEGLVVKMSWDGTGATRLVDSGVNNASFVNGWDASQSDAPPFFVYSIGPAEDVPDGHGLYVDTEAGGSQRKIQGAADLYGSQPVLSQDDAKLAFLGVADGYFDGYLYVTSLVKDETGLPTGVTEPVAVAQINLRFTEITWSPDGQFIALDQPVRIGSLDWNDIFVIQLSYDAQGEHVTGGSELLNVTNTPNVYESHPVWSPLLAGNTSHIAFVVPRTTGRGGTDIFTMLPNGTDVLLAVSDANSGVLSNGLPTWSPDGQQIGFNAVGKKGEEAVMRSAADGNTSAANLTGFTRERHVRRIRWRP